MNFPTSLPFYIYIVMYTGFTFLGKKCDSAHILIYLFQCKTAIYFVKFLVQFFIRAKQTFHMSDVFVVGGEHLTFDQNFLN